MPLFMDFHELDEISEETIDQLKKGHLLDLAVQAKYNVCYKHYYISRHSKKVFCVMEGPDKESCEAVHREAHGLTSCNIIQVVPGEYGRIMGEGISDPEGLLFHKNGTIDSGSRILLFIHTITSLLSDKLDEDYLQTQYSDYSNEIRRTLAQKGGREVESRLTEKVYAYTSHSDAIECSFLLQDRLAKLNKKLRDQEIRFETTIVLNAGDPVTYKNEFFGDVIQLARRMAHLGKDGAIILSSCVREHFFSSKNLSNNATVKTTGVDDERFINRLMDILENRIHNEDFNIIELSQHVGTSRPQLYRKIHALYGMSPNQLVNELRLKEATRLLNNKFGNISEIAFQVGFNNPSYFAKCFKNRFGILPSRYADLIPVQVRQPVG